MAIHYFDTSALVKLYVKETGSDWIKQIFDTPGQNIAFASIGMVEAASALARRQRMGEITNYQQRALYSKLLRDIQHRFDIQIVTDKTIHTAADITQRHPLRGYDAVHLAAALELNKHLTANQLPTITFVSADEKLYQAAADEGLQTENPNYR